MPSTTKRKPTTRKPTKLNRAAIKEAEIELARRDFGKFIEYVLRDKDGSRVRNAPHHEAWDQHKKYSIEHGKGPIILGPMGHAKTQREVIGFTLFMLGQNPNFEILIGSSAEDVAAKRLRKIGEYIRKSTPYHEVFPWVRPDFSKEWNSHRLNVVRTTTTGDDGMTGGVESSVSAYGWNSSEVTGARCQILIFDDIVDTKSLNSMAHRLSLKEAVTTNFLTRPDLGKALYNRWGEKISDGPIVLTVGTRYHEEDLYADFLKQIDAYCTLVQGVSEDFDCFDLEIYGALVDEAGVPTHPVYQKYKDWQPAAA
jgi:hypothetical protein